MADTLIVLEMNDGMADTSVAHLPAEERWFGRGGPKTRFSDYEWTPTRWASMCGEVNGTVYNRGGPLEQTPICWPCRIAQIVADAVTQVDGQAE